MVSAPESSVDDEIPAENFHTPPDEVFPQSQSSDEAKDTDDAKDIHFVDTLLSMKNSQGNPRVLEPGLLNLISSKKSKPFCTSLGLESPDLDSNPSRSYLGLKFSDSRNGNVSSGKSKPSSTFKSVYPLAGDAQGRISASIVVNSCENLKNPKNSDRNGSDNVCVESFLDEDVGRTNIDILAEAASKLEGSHSIMNLVDAGEGKMGLHKEDEKGGFDGDEGGFRNNREGDDVSVKENVRGRHLPSSFREYECGLESEFGRKLIPPQKSWVNSVREILNALSKGREDKIIDDNVFDVAINHGVRFPRPRWWRRDGYGKEGRSGFFRSDVGIEDGLKTDAEKEYKFDIDFVPLDTNDSLLQDC